MYLIANDDFGMIEWEDPADAGITWWADRAHAPGPLAPLGGEFVERWVLDGLGGRCLTLNGYLYMDPECEPSPHDFGIPAVQAWDEQFEERVVTACERVRRMDSAATPGDALRQMDEALDESARAFTFTMDVVGGLIPLIGRLIGVCTKAVGREGPLEAFTILTGEANTTLASAASLEEMALEAERDEESARMVRAGHAEAILQGSTELSRLFRAFLTAYGGRCPNWFDLHLPTWAEQPAEPLGIVARYLDWPDQRPSRVLAQAGARRDEAIERIASRLDDSEREEFRSMLPGLTGVVRTLEERALWQSLTFAALRVPALALGTSLMAIGAIDQPSDIFYLRRSEILAAAEGGPRVQAVVASRRRDLDRWADLLPPVSVGKGGVNHAPPPEWGSADLAQVRALAERGSRVLAGVGVARGVASGRACVAPTLEEAESKLHPGDILVCQMTSPQWTPLFSIAAGMVTDAGGMLSHAAITAREYGIPAVAATVRGTRDIPDGAMLRIDGALGTVEIVPD